MYKVNMLKLLTTVALLTVASVLDAAPLMSGEPDAFGEPADGGETGQNQLTVYMHAFGFMLLSKTTYSAFHVYI